MKSRLVIYLDRYFFANFFSKNFALRSLSLIAPGADAFPEVVFPPPPSLRTVAGFLSTGPEEDGAFFFAARDALNAAPLFFFSVLMNDLPPLDPNVAMPVFFVPDASLLRGALLISFDRPKVLTTPFRFENAEAPWSEIRVFPLLFMDLLRPWTTRFMLDLREGAGFVGFEEVDI